LEFAYEPFCRVVFFLCLSFFFFIRHCNCATAFSALWCQCFERWHLFRTYPLHETAISRAFVVRLMDQSWRRARLRAIRRQLFGASVFHRDSDVDTYVPCMLCPAYAARTIQVCGIYLTFCHVSSCALRGNTAIGLHCMHSEWKECYHCKLKIVIYGVISSFHIARNSSKNQSFTDWKTQGSRQSILHRSLFRLKTVCSENVKTVVDGYRAM